jgi:hypothetical protein
VRGVARAKAAGRRVRGRRRAGGRRRLLALLAFRDEMRFLPGFFANVPEQVDGIIALDDGSLDGSAEFAVGRPKVLEVLRVPPGTHADNSDSVLRRTLIQAAWKHDAHWLLGIDADERLEVGFRERAEREIARAEAGGHDAMWVPFKELWEPARVRVDGIWGTKRKACLFRSSRAHVFDDRRIHTHWASVPEPAGGWPVADLRLYHLRMIEPADRIARVERYRRLDPDLVWQPLGYDYMLDASQLELVDIEPGREYAPAAREAHERAAASSR